MISANLRFTITLIVLLFFSNAVFSQSSNEDGDDLLLYVPALIAAIKKGNADISASLGASINASCPPSNEMVALFNQTNLARTTARSCGVNAKPAVAALAWNCKLARAAQNHSQDMSDNQFLGHTSSDGSTLSERVDAQAYNWNLLAENIAAGYTSATSVMSAWINSESHCLNIMSNNVIHIGAAEMGGYWTVVFGRGQ